MKCQKCGRENANTHVKSIINGERREYILCADCAREMGYGNMFSDMQQEFSNMLGSFFGNTLPAVSQSTHCQSCGSTYYDIADSGRVGCADCYSTFYDLLLPSIRRIHGNTTHCGKKSIAGIEYTETEPKKTSKAENLKAELDKAVAEQRFEDAAKIRDEIKELEQNNG